MELTNNIPTEVMDLLASKGASARIALVGASTNPRKYGNIILKNLVGKGYEVVPLNPTEGSVEGLKAYPSIAEVEGPIAMVNFVVRPRITLGVLEAIKDSGIEAVWFQDGSFDEEVVAFARRHFKYVVHNACIMVVTNYV